MKASELMVGNYVEQPGRIGKICEVWQEAVKLDGYNNAYDYNHTKPIPLTEQWLLDFGFETTSIRTYELPNTRGLVIISKMKGEFLIKLNTNTIWIKHIHQLQNLYFALTGEELTLKKNMDI